jgi:hypothetical protein
MQLWTRWNKACWDAGFEAADAGKPMAACPFYQGKGAPDPDAGFWYEGWVAAYATREAKGAQ